MVALRLLAGVGGVVLAALTVMSAVKTFVLPRRARTRLSRIVFVAVRFLFEQRMRFQASFADRDRTFALYAPVALLLLPVAWLIAVGAGFTAIYWALEEEVGWARAIELSGSALLTLGTTSARSLPAHLATYAEACLGLGLLAILISYLPAMYASFQRREQVVTLLDVRANTPPTAQNMLERYQVIHGLDQLEALWPQWEHWFADLEESHTTFGAMAYFRSPQPGRSWVTAAGAVLDAASFVISSVDAQPTAGAQVCVRAGYVALRGIAEVYDIPVDHDPAPDGPISVTRAEYDAMWDRLAAAGMALKADREQAWRDFRGWRVNYDEPLLALCGLVMAPPAPWSSDRAHPYRRSRLQLRRSSRVSRAGD